MYQKVSVNKWRLPNTVIRLYNSIISNENYLSGSPTIEGTRISPFVIAMFHEGGDSIDVLCNLYDIPKHKIKDAIEYCEKLKRPIYSRKKMAAFSRTFRRKLEREKTQRIRAQQIIIEKEKNLKAQIAAEEEILRIENEARKPPPFHHNEKQKSILRELGLVHLIK